MSQEIWDELYIVSEAHLRGTSTAEEQQLIKDNQELYLEVLKAQKSKVEYQFTSNKLVVAELYSDYTSGQITLEQFREYRKEQLAWKVKAVSYLSRIDQEIIKTKVSIEYDN